MGVVPIVPWSFLAPLKPSPSANPSPSQPLFQKKSFAQVVNTSTAIALSQLPRPSLKGDRVSIRISDDEYQLGLDSCKNNLHGRLLLPKGSQPFRVNDLRSKLLKLWKPLGQWRMTPLGRGFYEFSFASLEDLRSVWAVGTWNLRPGLLRLSQWSPDFKPQSAANTYSVLGSTT